MKFTTKQKEFLEGLEYINCYELKDLYRGFTDIDVLLDPDDREKYDLIEED